MTKNDLREGMVLVLTKTIPNPNKDGRVTRDWTKAAEFKPGRYIVDTEWIGDGKGFPTITKENDEYRILYRIGPRHAAFLPFIDACVEGEETLQTVLAVNGADRWTDEILRILVERKKITLADVKSAIAKFIEE